MMRVIIKKCAKVIVFILKRMEKLTGHLETHLEKLDTRTKEIRFVRRSPKGLLMKWTNLQNKYVFNDR